MYYINKLCSKHGIDSSVNSTPGFEEINIQQSLINHTKKQGYFGGDEEI